MKAAQWITVWFLEDRVPASNPIKKENSSTTETFGGFRNRSLHFFSPPNFHFFLDRMFGAIRDETEKPRARKKIVRNKFRVFLKITQKVLTRAFFLQPFAEREKKPLHVAFERGGNRTRVASTAIKFAPLPLCL